MGKRDRRSDEELLGAAVVDDAAFGVFYRRYERLVLAYFVRAVDGGELAADLTAETFAELVSSLSRFDASAGSGSGWLFGIASNVLARSRQRGRVEDRARRGLSLARLAVTDEMIERIEHDSGHAYTVPLTLPRALEQLLSQLPAAQRVAIEAHVLGERDYEQIASQLDFRERRSPARQPRFANPPSTAQGGAMSLYLPELEQQLREAIRAQAQPADKRRSAFRNRTGTAVALGGSIAVAIAVVLVVLTAGTRSPRTVPMPTSTHTLTGPYASFEAFRRPRQASDGISARARAGFRPLFGHTRAPAWSKPSDPHLSY